MSFRKLRSPELEDSPWRQPRAMKFAQKLEELGESSLRNFTLDTKEEKSLYNFEGEDSKPKSLSMACTPSPTEEPLTIP